MTQTAIAGSTITIFSKTWCPYCKRAKSLLTTEFPDVKTEIVEYVPVRSRALIDSVVPQRPIFLIDSTHSTTALKSRTTCTRRQDSAPFPTSSSVRALRSMPVLLSTNVAFSPLTDQKHVGGCDTVVALNSGNKLAALVRA